MLYSIWKWAAFISRLYCRNSFKTQLVSDKDQIKVCVRHKCWCVSLSLWWSKRRDSAGFFWNIRKSMNLTKTSIVALVLQERATAATTEAGAVKGLCDVSSSFSRITRSVCKTLIKGTGCVHWITREWKTVFKNQVLFRNINRFWQQRTKRENWRHWDEANLMETNQNLGWRRVRIETWQFSVKLLYHLFVPLACLHSNVFLLLPKVSPYIYI